MEVTSNRVCACGRDYSARSWAALPLYARLTDEQISSLVTRWQPHLVVEIRVCACKRQMACLCDRAALSAAKCEPAIAA
ncbi:MAG: hypothetical protein ABSC94_25615 [Polyangiaceae bacterium]|jgi:hypothetical protein